MASQAMLLRGLLAKYEAARCRCAASPLCRSGPIGIRQSRMNPNTCTICETMFERVMKARQIEIDATILFADLRGYTSLSQSQSSGAIASAARRLLRHVRRGDLGARRHHQQDDGRRRPRRLQFPDASMRTTSAHAVAAARRIQELWRARRRRACRMSSALTPQGRRRNWPRYGPGQFRRVWPHAPGSDRDRHGGERRLPRAERGGGRSNSHDQRGAREGGGRAARERRARISAKGNRAARKAVGGVRGLEDESFGSVERSRPCVGAGGADPSTAYFRATRSSLSGSSIAFKIRFV